jgi:hypothetical protein
MNWWNVKHWFAEPVKVVQQTDMMEKAIQPLMAELDETERARRRTMIQIMTSLGVKNTFGNECDLEKEFRNMFGAPNRSG